LISASSRPSPTGCARSGPCLGWGAPAVSTTGPTARHIRPKTENRATPPDDCNSAAISLPRWAHLGGEIAQEQLARRAGSHLSILH
jgi:hypothetical protein